MAQLRLDISGERLEALKRYASRRGLPVTALIDGYVAYLLSGGEPVQAEDLSELAQRGGSFDWLRDEPEVYSLADGEPI